jgi:hypothetical protein
MECEPTLDENSIHLEAPPSGTVVEDFLKLCIYFSKVNECCIKTKLYGVDLIINHETNLEHLIRSLYHCLDDWIGDVLGF